MASMGKRKHTPDHHVPLGEALVIGTAAELHAQLGEALASSDPVVLDATAVTRLDTSGLQLLQAFVEARDANDGPWQWANVSEALRTAAALLGLQPMLKLPDVSSATV